MDINLSLLGLLYAGLVIWAVLNIAQSHQATLGKAIWLLVVLVPQPIGAFVWLFFGPRNAERSSWREDRYTYGSRRHDW